MNLVAISLAMTIGVFALILRWRVRAWSHPAVIFAGFTCLIMLVPLLAVRNIPVTPSGMAYILAAVVFFCIPSLLIRWDTPIAAAAGRLRRSATPLRGLLPAAILAQAIAIVCVAINLKLQGFSVAELFTHPIRFACEYLSFRYHGQVQPNLAFVAGTVLNYVGAPLGGFVLATRRNLAAKLGVLVLCLTPSLLDLLVYNDKGTLPLTLAFMFGGVLAGRVRIGNVALITRQTLLACVAILIISTPAMLLSLANRGGDCADQSRSTKVFQSITSVIAAPKGATATTATPKSVTAATAAPNSVAAAPAAHTSVTAAPASPNSVTAGGTTSIPLTNNIKTYAFGHVFAFSDWLNSYLTGDETQHYTNPSQLTFGFWTFMAVGKIINPHYQVPRGYFALHYKTPDGSLGTNIYTMYRGLIYDFGLPGSLVFMAALGLIVSLAYRNMLLNEQVPLSQSIIIIFAGFAYSSFALSIGTWPSVYVATAIVFALLWLTQPRRARAP